MLSDVIKKYGGEKMVLSAYMESLDETSVSRLSFATIATAPDKKGLWSRGYY